MATILRLPEVKQRTGNCRTGIYDAVKAGTFPAPVAIGPRAVGWLDSDIDAWITSRPRAGGPAVQMIASVDSPTTGAEASKPSGQAARRHHAGAVVATTSAVTSSNAAKVKVAV
jgi:prophage regulatory protein